jgi:hypothetical protein
MKVIKIDETGLEFDDGTKISDIHQQDCCEHVYADWQQLKDTDILNKEIDEIKIEGVKDSGFRLNGYFIPCYNEQNGYYGDELSLEITKSGSKEKRIIDISEFVEDNVC